MLDENVVETRLPPLVNYVSSAKCSTDKTKVYSCELKARTCGVEIICSNCGIILGYRELYGSESCTQVGAMLVDFRENFQGIVII